MTADLLAVRFDSEAPKPAPPAWSLEFGAGVWGATRPI
jgi:hypothetical protein